LLPTKDYKPGWLKIMNGEAVLANLPQLDPYNFDTRADPYSQIYATKAQDVWWGMIDETLIDPAGLVEGQTSYQAYAKAIEAAHDFHDALGLYFHPNTYAHYGADEKENSFHSVRWQAGSSFGRDLPNIGIQHAEELMKASAQTWTKRGQCKVEFNGAQVKFKLAGKDGGGDATVPEPSGAIVEKAKLIATFRMKGFEHALSYNDPHVLDNTVYCIGRIVQDAKPIKELPQKGMQCSATNEPGAASDAPSLPSQPASTPPADMQAGIA